MEKCFCEGNSQQLELLEGYRKNNGNKTKTKKHREISCTVGGRGTIRITTVPGTNILES